MQTIVGNEKSPPKRILSVLQEVGFAIELEESVVYVEVTFRSLGESQRLLQTENRGKSSNRLRRDLAYLDVLDLHVNVDEFLILSDLKGRRDHRGLKIEPF